MTLAALVGILIGLIIVAAFCSVYACHLAIQAQIEVKALQKSTHQVQFVPVDSDEVEADEVASGKAMKMAEEMAWDDLVMGADQPLS